MSGFKNSLSNLNKPMRSSICKKFWLGVALLISGCSGERPPHLGSVNSHLADCPLTPNCVSSFSKDPEHQISLLQFASTPEQLIEDLKTILHETEEAHIITIGEHYIYAEFTSKVFRFVDDVEFLLDPQTQTLHFRSASRIGHSDLGVNRERIETLKAALAQKG